MRVLVTGATGFIGARLCQALRERGERVKALSRAPREAERTVQGLEQCHTWDPSSWRPPEEAFYGIDAVVHLAGEPIIGRWTADKRKEIRRSRVLGTRHLVDTLVKLTIKPKILLCASAIGFYGDCGDSALTESSPPGEDFLADTCQKWEWEAIQAEQHGIRVIRMRTGIVLGSGGGALAAMLKAFRLGLGGPLGDGEQWWSWIHRDDLVGLIIHALENEYNGAINGTAPEPRRQKDFAEELAAAINRPARLVVPTAALKALVGGFSTELLSSKKVIPEAAEYLGYEFKYPTLGAALSNGVTR